MIQTRVWIVLHHDHQKAKNLLGLHLIPQINDTNNSTFNKNNCIYDRASLTKILLERIWQFGSRVVCPARREREGSVSTQLADWSSSFTKLLVIYTMADLKIDTGNPVLDEKITEWLKWDKVCFFFVCT